MNADEYPTDETDIANIHLNMLGEMRVFPVTVRLGKRVPLDLLTAARELTMQAIAVVIEQARTEGRVISCKVGCGVCCRQLVPISVVEAQALADLVSALPPEQQRKIHERFSDALSRLESARILVTSLPKGQRALRVEMQGEVSQQTIVAELGKRYFLQGIPCPFLENESCSVYPDRPLICREYHVSSPSENCAKLYRVKIDRVQPPLRMSNVLARTISRISTTFSLTNPLVLPLECAEVNGGKRRQTYFSNTIPLVMSLEWAAVNSGKLRQPYDGLEMFKILISEMDREYELPFDERAGMV
jgi:Fe-S-cluster containining protein